jgi:hypothetical protein
VKQRAKDAPLFPTKKQRGKRINKADVAAWQRAIDDLIASVMSLDVEVRPVITAEGYAVQRAYFAKENDFQRKAAELRSTLLEYLPDAIRLFKEVKHPRKHKGCHCRAYCLIRVNANYAAKITGDSPRDIAVNAKEMYDDYIADRN